MRYKQNFSTSDYYRKLQSSVLLLLVSILAFIFVPYLITDVNAATDVSAYATWTPITLSIADYPAHFLLPYLQSTGIVTIR